MNAIALRFIGNIDTLSIEREINVCLWNAHILIQYTGSAVSFKIHRKLYRVPTEIPADRTLGFPLVRAVGKI